MRLERVGGNQIKIFLTFEELAERGLSREDVEKNSLKWHQLFFDMINEAYEEFELSIEGSIIIDIYALQAQGMVILFTLNEEEDLFMDYAVFYTKNSKEESPAKELLYCFSDIENLIHFAFRVRSEFDGGTLFFYNQQYYLYIPLQKDDLCQKLLTILSDYGERSKETLPFIQEYGKMIVEHSAVQLLIEHF